MTHTSISICLSPTSGAAAITTLPALSGGNAYVDVRGTRRLLPNYTGSLFKLYCATATPTTYEIPQDANGEADETGALTWAAGGTVYVDGWYYQDTGNYAAAASDAKKCRYFFRSESGHKLATFGWGASSSVLDQGYISEALSIDRQDCSLWSIGIAAGVSSACRFASLDSAVPGIIFGMNIDGSSGLKALQSSGGTARRSTLLVPVNNMSVLGVVSRSTGLNLHVNERVSELGATTSGTGVAAYFGRNTTSTTFFATGERIGHFLTQTAPTTDEEAAIKAACITMASVPTDRSNIILATPHSLAVGANAGVYGNYCWRQVKAEMSEQAEILVVGVNGQTMAAQYTDRVAEIMDYYESGADNYIYYLASACNDANALTSGFAGGDPGIIATAAQTIFDNYMDMKDALKGQGANVSVVMQIMWTPLSTFFSGTAQDKADKQAVLDAFHVLVAANDVAEGYTICNESSVSSLGDSIHPDETGEGQRAAIQGPIFDSIIAA